MHILFLEFYSSDPMPNYPELAAVHRANGHKVWLARRRADGDLEWNDGEKIVYLQPGPARLGFGNILPGFLSLRLGLLRFILCIRHFLKVHHPDVVHVNPSSLFYVFLLPPFIRQTTLFIMDVRQLGEWNQSGLLAPLKNWKRRKRLWFNARFIYRHTCFMSEAAAHRILGPRWSRWGSVQRIAVDRRFLEVQSHRARNGAAEAVRFLYVGTLSMPRRLEHLLLAAQQLAGRTGQFHLDMIGPDHSEGYYQRLIEKLHIGEFVSICPPVPYQEIPERIVEADVGLAYVRSIADWRYQPTLKVVEYRAAGIPIIASDNEPNRELVFHEKNGLLVDDSHSTLADAMEKFVLDRNFLSSCKENAARMRDGRTWNDVAEKYYREVYVVNRPEV